MSACNYTDMETIVSIIYENEHKYEATKWCVHILYSCVCASRSALYKVDFFQWFSFYSLSIIYLVFAFANWIAAPIVAVIGPRIAMFIGAIVYT